MFFFIVLGMEKMRFYDEAAHNFYAKMELQGYPLSALDFYAQHFTKLCKDLQDVHGLSSLAEEGKWHKSAKFRDEIVDKEQVIVVTDTNLNIVFATQNMTEMNGYQPNEVLGKKPKMFQGEGTCKETTKKVSLAIKNYKPFEVILTNYRKNGTPYQCWIKGSPVFDTAGKVVNFIAFEKEVA
ncbi:PAS domain-containing protein [Flagellimonas flava]|uniref:PAS domain S-box-containing protein n=1 Tax=Flagellimonas flava TaxID=570519 RepID=A0A1M5KS49_9FLAO|nr:PAS domain-containing protein [Allomuricauda flava]SHG55369.1 PAS domain S-box-containing protein [Allomuricauda flava]